MNDGSPTNNVVRRMRYRLSIQTEPPLTVSSVSWRSITHCRGFRGNKAAASPSDKFRASAALPLVQLPYTARLIGVLGTGVMKAMSSCLPANTSFAHTVHVSIRKASSPINTATATTLSSSCYNSCTPRNRTWL